MSNTPLKEETQNEPDFSSLPPVYVLPTHLNLDALHRIEDDLVEHGARLTYDVSEARLILGQLGQRKRAALELRSRGVWTEEVATKRRRVRSALETGLGSATESEDDGLARPRLGSISPDRSSVASTRSRSSSVDGEQEVTVVRLDWLREVLETQTLLPIEPFVVYRGRMVARPTAAADRTTGILQRAKQDAMSAPPATRNRFAARRSPPGPSSQGHAHPPRLYRQTTSEHEEAVPLPPPPDWVRDRVMYACLRSAPLHPPNEAFISQLVKIRRIRELTLDEIGVRAYSTSIAALAAYPYPIQQPAEILRLPGCDAKIAALFAEFRASADGTLAAAAALDSDPALHTLHLFANIWGVGAKTARDFYYQRHWRDLDDIIEHGWPTLSRVQQIGLKYYDEFLAGVSRAESEAIAHVVAAHARRVRPAAFAGDIHCILVGGYRRGKTISGDVDLVLSHRDAAVTKDLVVDLVGSLEADGWITHTLALHMTASHRDQLPPPYRGDEGRHFDTLDKALVVWQDPNFDGGADDDDENHNRKSKRKRNPNTHRRVDIIISPWRTVGCAVLGWSGDMTFERDLRRYAKKMHGWKFDSSGVRERRAGGQVIDLEGEGGTWEERERMVLEGLGVGWRAPGERCTR